MYNPQYDILISHTLLLTAFNLAHSTTVRADFTSYGGNGYAHNNNGTGREKKTSPKSCNLQ